MLSVYLSPAIPNSGKLWECGIGLPSPQPSPKLGRGSKKLFFPLLLPFSQNWEKRLALVGFPDVKSETRQGLGAEG
jgi:hypothetical protein